MLFLSIYISSKLKYKISKIFLKGQLPPPPQEILIRYSVSYLYLRAVILGFWVIKWLIPPYLPVTVIHDRGFHLRGGRGVYTVLKMSFPPMYPHLPGTCPPLLQKFRCAASLLFVVSVYSKLLGSSLKLLIT